MTLNYRIEGNGPALLLVHGLGVTFPIWQELVPLLSPHYKLILVELPGNGASSPPPPDQAYYPASAAALEELRQELQIERWHILGYSMGAWVVQAYLQHWAERAGRVAFLCPAQLNRHWSLGLGLITRVDRFLPNLASWLLSGWRLRQLVLLLGFNGRPHPFAALWQREIESQPVAAIKAALGGLPGLGRAPFTLPPAPPALFIWGRTDAITARPRPLRALDRIVEGNHSAPMLAAVEISELLLNYFK